MNPVENPLTQRMQAFGAAPTDATFGAFGANSASAETDANIIAQFSGYIEGMDPAASAASAAAFAGLTKNPLQLTHGVPTDAAFAVNPSAIVEPANILVNTVPANPTSLQAVLTASISGGADGDRLTPETAAAYSLAANYHTTTPVALSAADLQALQSSAPALFATLTASPALVTATTPQPVAADQGLEVPGQFLPASDLKALFGETPTLLSGTAGRGHSILAGPLVGAADQMGILHTSDQLSKSLDGIVTPATTARTPVANVSLSAGDVPASTATTPVASGLTDLHYNKSASFENGSEISRSNMVTAKAQAHSASQNVEPELDADGQILTVAQNGQKPNGSKIAAATQSTTKALQASQTQGQNAASALQATTAPAPATGAAGSSAKRGTENSTESLVNNTAKTKAPEATAGAATNAANAMPRGSFDWTSPWITPERAAGWPDGFATSLVSTGLGGLMGNPSGLSGLSMLGGQPNPALGGHVTKQLNLNMTRAVKAGEQEFSMRMDPPELGRVSVKLRFGQNGLVKSQIMAERPETLEMLQREIRGLERAIEAGGHKSEQGGISFSLDSGGQESAGKAFAEAMQQDRLQQEIDARSGEQGDNAFAGGDIDEVEVDLDEILARITPETGLDVRV